jgi:hypothetical protein
VILAGDLNVAHTEKDVHDPKGKEKIPGYTPQERASFAKLLERGFVDTFRHLYPDRVQYSYWSLRHKLRESNRGWRVDYFLISKNQFEQDAPKHIELVDSTIMDTQMGSDHCPVGLQIRLLAGHKPPRAKPDEETKEKADTKKGKRTNERQKSVQPPKTRKGKHADLSDETEEAKVKP